ncbi:MAG: LysR substrate-binding domain-containing protein [Cypionkella sp.]|nr:LysR family transcriptional regulator [Cypionkella sp.]
MTTPPLNALRAFEAVARFGSFKAAADALFVTQSAISHQVRHFEDWLGTPLFEREGNRARLLPHGADLGRALSLSLSEIEAACNRLRAGTASQALVIATIPSVAMCWLIPRLSAFRAAYPEIETRIVYAMHGRDINFNDIDLAFVFAPQPPQLPGVISQFFLKGDSAPVCSPTLLQKTKRPPQTTADLVALGLLHDGGHLGWEDWLRQAGLAPEPALVGPIFEDFNLLRAAALSGQGVALCPLAMVGPDIASGSLVQLFDHTRPVGSDYFVLSTTARNRRTEKSVKAFVDWALAERDG